MILFLLAVAALDRPNEPAVSAAIAAWQNAVRAVQSSAPSGKASRAEQVRYLIRLDEITRQNLWVMDDPSLTRDQQRQVGSYIGPEMNKVDASNTAILKELLPKSGWFSNHIDGRQITHGAWLIAQHSPDRAFMTYALSKMSKLVRSGGVDGRDYALTYDRVQVSNHLPQRYGSQFRCLSGRLSLEPIEAEPNVDALREEVGWSQTLAETEGDNEIGKPCIQ